MFRILIGIFLIAHGLVHSGLVAAPIPNDPNSKPGAFLADASRSWLLSSIGLSTSAIRITGIVLVALATLSFLAAGLGVLGVSGLNSIWRTMTVISACLSLILLIVFWHPWLVVGGLAQSWHSCRASPCTLAVTNFDWFIMKKFLKWLGILLAVFLCGLTIYGIVWIRQCQQLTTSISLCYQGRFAISRRSGN
jgi:hypothetical protein